MDTNPDNVIRPRNFLRRADLDRLTAAAETLGEHKALIRLRELGAVHCLAPDIGEDEFIRALARAGLGLSSIDGVWFIHRLPPSAA